MSYGIDGINTEEEYTKWIEEKNKHILAGIIPPVFDNKESKSMDCGKSGNKKKQR